MASANAIAMQLLPEHRLFAQAFVATRGDRGQCIVATNRPCPPRSIRSRCDSLLSRADIQRYIYALLQADPAALTDLRADVEWRDTIEDIIRNAGAGAFSADNSPSSRQQAPGSLIPVGAAQGCPSVATPERIPIGDMTCIQRFWLEMTFDPYQPAPVRLKASELYSRSVGAFDPQNNKTTRTPITIKMPPRED